MIKITIIINLAKTELYYKTCLNLIPFFTILKKL